MNRSPLLLNKVKSLKTLKSVHARLLIGSSVILDDLTVNMFLRLYAKFGATQYARHLFDKIPQPNAFLWTSLIHGYIENTQYLEALSVFRWMRSEAVEPLNFTIASVLSALARLERLKDGEAAYVLVLKLGFGFDLVVQNSMTNFFMRCGDVVSAERVFNGMVEKKFVSWNSMISGYGNNGKVGVARALFNVMPDRNVISWTSMIQGYVKAGNMEEARFLFDIMPTKDTAVWNLMLSGYIDSGDIISAKYAFEAMPHRNTGT